LPSKVETIEDDPIHGDALVEVFFGDWRKVDGVPFPSLVTHELHDDRAPLLRGKHSSGGMGWLRASRLVWRRYLLVVQTTVTVAAAIKTTTTVASRLQGLLQV
jgi:hypothetical protein